MAQRRSGAMESSRARFQNIKLLKILLISITLTGTLSFTTALTLFTDSISIRSTGQISVLKIYAASGSATDIQAAVDQVIAAGGIGDVYIPAGIFNFVEIGEPWVTVNVPAGVNIYGAPTERTSGLSYDGIGQDPNDQVVEWKTVLIIPYDAPGSWSPVTSWFKIIGTSDPNESSRFSDIKLVGYRSIDPKSVAVQEAVGVTNVINYRIDHCYFEHTGLGVGSTGVSNKGVIDHNYFVNPVAATVGPDMDDWTVFYGVVVSRGEGDYWDDNIANVLGQYTDYTTVIENCYFEKWRHDVAANGGAHYVFRHNTIQDCFGFGSLDAHGWGTEVGGEVTAVGTRAVEIYNNDILDAFDSGWATFIRGGAGVAFNNRVGGDQYHAFIYLSNEGEVPKTWVNDWWIWDNTMLPSAPDSYIGGADCRLLIKIDPEENITEGVNYWFTEPHTFSYQPYSYPHPLTLDTTP